MSGAAAPSSAAAGLPCPRCRVDLVMSERQGIEIDYCPSCRGVWLDRGELDKIIERNAQYTALPPQGTEAAPTQPSPGAASPWLAPGQGTPPPGYAPGTPPPPPGWRPGYDQHGGYGRHGDGQGHGGGHESGRDGGHGGMRGGHNSFLGRLFG